MAKFEAFIPEVWSKEIQRQLDRISIFTNLVNDNYEGEITQGGSVKVYNLSDSITISDYDPTATTALTKQKPTVSTSEMIIDNAKYFNFAIDDIIKLQTNLPLLEAYTQRGAVAISNVIDTHLYSHYVDVDASHILGTDGTPIALTKDNIIIQILKLEELMNISNVPLNGRWLAVSSEVATLLKELGYDKTTFNQDPNTLASGQITKVGMFTIYESGAVRPVAGVHNLLAGTMDFISFANQIQKVEAYRPEDRFEDAVKGLNVYGSKVFNPKLGGLIKGSVA